MPKFATPTQIRDAFTKVLPVAKRDPNIQGFWGADPQYYLPDKQEIETFLANNINFPPADLGAGFDCDDYAYAVKGCIGLWNLNHARQNASWCVGVIFAKFNWVAGAHAANWFMDKTGTIALFEPQDHGFHTVNDIVGDVKLVLL